MITADFTLREVFLETKGSFVVPLPAGAAVLPLLAKQTNEIRELPFRQATEQAQ